MLLATVAPLADWDNFYVIVGSSAAALTGLTFVVITLIGDDDARRNSQGVNAFTTPTVFHFGAALVICAASSAPWPALWPIALLLGLGGVGGMIYFALIISRLRRVDIYTPVPEDWLWYAAFPFTVYTALVVAAALLPGAPHAALFGVGAAAVLLLVIGIHNAWDIVTYMAIDRRNQADAQKD